MMCFLQCHSQTQKWMLKTNALAQKLDPELEQFTIDFSQDSTSINLNLKWDRTMVSIPIE